MKKEGYIGIILFAICYVFSLFPDYFGLSGSALKMLGIVLLIATFWIFETIPIAATAIIPLFALPILGITPEKEVALSYGSSVIWLFMTGFFIAKTLERWGLQRRIALSIIGGIGSSPAKLVGGFLLATATISCFVSNTATALLMLPIGISTLSEVTPKLKPDRVKSFGTALMLAIAFGANIGGMGTPIGSPPNVIFLAVLQESFPNLAEISFLQWMTIALPLIAVFLGLTWLYLVKLFRIDRTLELEKLEASSTNLPPMSRGEFYVAILFLATVVLWITRADINLGEITINGWASALGLSKFAGDTTVGALICAILFSVTAIDKDGEKTALLDWETAKQIPWGILLLFGGGIALSKGFIASGLSAALAENLEFSLKGLPLFGVILIVSTLIAGLTEITSNTAMSSLMMPLLAGIAPLIDVNPALLMMPAALSASCAFMLPVATPPNAIVYSQKYFSIATMAKVGLVLNIFGIILITLAVNFLAVPILG